MAVDGEADIYMKKVVDTLQYVTIPQISKAYVSYISPDRNQLTVATKWTHKNYVTKKSDEFAILYNYDRCENVLYKVSTALETNTIVIETVSPSLKQRAVIKKQINETTKQDEYIMEVWSETKREKTINLSSYDQHGKVHSDSLFGSLTWSHDESKLVYVAEKKKAKTSGYFEKVSGTSDGDNITQGDQYDYEESWGEQLTDVRNTVLCVFTLSIESLQIVEGIPDNLCPLQPEFGPKNTLVFVAFNKLPFRLGVIYCDNRACGLYVVNLGHGENAVELTKGCNITANYHAKLDQSQTKLLFLQRELSGFGDPHRDSMSVMLYNFIDGSTKCVCNELKYDGKTFPCFIIGKNVKYNYWLPDNIHVALPTTLEGTNYVCFVDTESGVLKSMIECSVFLGMYKGIFLASYEKFNSESSTLMLIDCNNDDPSNPILATEPRIMDNEIECVILVDDHGLKSFYLIPKQLPDVHHHFPLFVSPHGGPHSTFMNDYNRNARLFCKLGYAVLLVNYRGSIGFTNESLKSLPGNIGTQDVNDVHDIVKKFISLKDNLIDTENIFLCGGSHGGFLSAHLIGQFPSFYRAACLRNPGIEIISKSVSADIPDWSYFESGLSYTQDAILTSDAALNMLSKSPVNYIANIKAPVLLCIGGKDARVPPSQGKYFFRLLKANNKVVKMLYYPNDCHPLSNVGTEGDNVINICKWFYQHGSHSK